ncbi:MAG: hypothetical protein EHM43_10785 [Ignavibacteriae bacterium]|nr:MAG: hypothetical protein EHM43_10785 [Ignavibacteriota bacterium]
MNKKPLLWVGISVGALVIVAAVGYLLFNDKVSNLVRSAAEMYIRSRVSSVVANASDSTVTVAFGDFDYGFFTHTLTIDNITFSYLDSTNATKQTLHVSIDKLVCTGLAPWDVLFGTGLTLGTISVAHPVFTLDIIDRAGVRTNDIAPIDTALVQLPQIPDVDSLLAILVARALPADVSPLTIDSVMVMNAGGRTYIKNDTAHMHGTMEGVDLTARKISVGAGSKIDAHLLSDFSITIKRWHRIYSTGQDALMEGGMVRINGSDSSMSVAHARLTKSGRNMYLAKGVVFSFAHHRLTIDSAYLGTAVTDKQWLAAQKHPADRMRISAEDVAMDNIDLDALTNGTALTVRKLSAGTLTIDILSSKLGRRPRVATRERMPHQLIRMIPFSVGIDTITVANASVRYAELRHESSSPGLLTWSKIEVTVTGLSSDTILQRHQPLKISAKGLFYDHAVMSATFAFPLHVTTYQMHGEGYMRGFDITRLNSFLPAIEGLRITSGFSDKATFRFDVRGRVARGFVDPVYRDLDFKYVNKRTKKGSWFTDITSFFGSWLGVKNDNPIGKKHQIGKVSYTIPRNSAIMETIWFPIRDGLGDVAGF